LEGGRNPRGWKAHVRYAGSSENRPHGASLGAQLDVLQRHAVPVRVPVTRGNASARPCHSGSRARLTNGARDRAHRETRRHSSHASAGKERRRHSSHASAGKRTEFATICGGAQHVHPPYLQAFVSGSRTATARLKIVVSAVRTALPAPAGRFRPSPSGRQAVCGSREGAALFSGQSLGQHPEDQNRY
jgi:hypothetical protein